MPSVDAGAKRGHLALARAGRSPIRHVPNPSAGTFVPSARRTVGMVWSREAAIVEG